MRIRIALSALAVPVLGLGLLTAPLLAAPAAAKEGGCVKDGAVGAVAGHFVGQGHAVAGATAGCAVGVHRRHEAEKHDQKQDQQKPGGNGSSG
ncbi:hypothetical protein ACX4MT_05825 [Roseomonas mucosa]